MKVHKTKAVHCKCCLTKNDLLQVTTEKQKIINSLLNLQPSQTLDDFQICINCNSSLSCIDKFRQNSLRAHSILEKCKLKNTFLSSVTDESVNSAFDTILNWMNDITVILKYYMTDVKDETTEEKESSEGESSQDYEALEMIHEEELFIGTVDTGETIKKEMEVEVLDEVKYVTEVQDYSSESSAEDDDNDNYFPNMKKRKSKTEQSRDDKRYTCDLCDKKYVLRTDLTYHMNVHAGINPFECGIDDCAKAYPHPRTLKIHQREVHNVLNGVEMKPPPVINDPEFDQKLEELKDENFEVDNFYVEERKGHKRAYQCRICSRYYNKTEFVYHRNLHLGLKPFQCLNCDKTFTNPFELGKHNRKIHENEDYKEIEHEKNNDNSSLKQLDGSFTNTDDDTVSYRSLEKFFVNERRGCRRAYQCPDCKKLYSRGELKYHLNTHKNIKPYSCVVEDCTKTFASPRDMRVHAKKYHMLRVKPVKDYSMKNIRSVSKREKIETKEKLSGEEANKVNVVCTVCGKSVRKKHFREHYQIHIKPDFSCPFKNQGCTEMFKNRMKLTSHIQAKHDPEYKPTTTSSCMCEHCGKRLTKAQLKYHMNLHLGLTPYVCDYPNCSEAYRSPNLLRQHIAGYHLKQMRFKCHYCSRRFNTKEEQDHHKTEDCGIKTATCHLCGRTMNKFSLKNHLLIHTGEKSWICDYEGCGKAFIRRDKLQQHKKQHSTEDHYTCPSCNSGFKYRSWLDMHIIKKHPENYRGD